MTQKQLEDANKSVVIGQRIRHHGAPGVEAANDWRYSDVLGRLQLEGVISQVQLDAGLEFSRRWSAWARYKVAQRRVLGSPSDLNRSGGEDCSPEPEVERIDKIAVQYREMLGRLDNLDQLTAGERRFWRAAELMERVCVDGLEMARTPANEGTLRASLNEMASLFKMGER